MQYFDCTIQVNNRQFVASSQHYRQFSFGCYCCYYADGDGLLLAEDVERLIERLKLLREDRDAQYKCKWSVFLFLFAKRCIAAPLTDHTRHMQLHSRCLIQIEMVSSIRRS